MGKLRKKNIYPIEYNGKIYHENDVDEIFNAFYYDREIYELGDGSIYISEGLSIYPDGTYKNDD